MSIAGNKQVVMLRPVVPEMVAILPPNGLPSGRESPFYWKLTDINNRISGQILGWTGLIRVDGKTYTWMGAPYPEPTAVAQTSFEYTSTRSTFIMDVGGLVAMNITFLSPLTPTDMMRQSLPFSYLDVVVSSSDGVAHDVQLYTDITAGKHFTSVIQGVRIDKNL